MKIKEIFGNYRVVALAGEKDEGKTNNLMALLKDFRKENEKTPIYVYGLNEQTLSWLKQFKNIFEISSIKQLSNKRDCLIIIDEFQRLKLNCKRKREHLNDFVDFIYHNNNWLILTTPNPREFNSVIGSKIEGWCLKSLKLSNLVNGSHLKEAVLSYNGRYKSIDDININKDEILIINNDYEKIIKVNYIPEIDTKKKNVNIFEIKKSPEKGPRNSPK